MQKINNIYILYEIHENVLFNDFLGLIIIQLSITR